MAKVLTIGEMLMRFTPVNKKRLNQDDQMSVYFGGAEANTAMSLSQFGHDVSFLSALPSNDIGEAAFSHLRMMGVDTSLVFRTGDRMGSYFLEEGFGLKPTKVIYDRKYSSVNELPGIEIDWEEVYQGIDVLHITGITPALSEKMKAFTILSVSEAKKHGVKVSFDFNFRSKLWNVSKAKETFKEILPYVDICFMGYKDFTLLWGFEGPAEFHEETLAHFYRGFAERYEIEWFASTNRVVHSASNNELQGFVYKYGSLVKSRNWQFDILDRIGGGDAFAAGVLHGILRGFELEKIAEFGTASSVLKHSVLGDYNRFTEKEVNEFLELQGGDVSR